MKGSSVLGDIKLGIRLAWKAKLILVGFMLLFFMVLVSWMASEFSGRQPATVGLDVGLSFVRIVVPIFIALLVQEIISKEFDKKYYLDSLSYPRSRSEFFIARLLAVFFMALALLVVMAGVLSAVVLHIQMGYAQSTPVALGVEYALVILFISLDALLLVCVAGCLGVISSTPGFVLIGTIGFMMVARSYSSVLLLLGSGVEVVSNTAAYRETIGWFRYLLPDLGALDIRPIVLYSDKAFFPSDWPLLIASILFYGMMLVSFSIFFFNKRELG